MKSPYPTILTYPNPFLLKSYLEIRMMHLVCLGMLKRRRSDYAAPTFL